MQQHSAAHEAAGARTPRLGRSPHSNSPAYTLQSKPKSSKAIPDGQEPADSSPKGPGTQKQTSAERERATVDGTPPYDRRSHRQLRRTSKRWRTILQNLYKLIACKMTGIKTINSKMLLKH